MTTPRSSLTRRLRVLGSRSALSERWSRSARADLGGPADLVGLPVVLLVMVVLAGFGHPSTWGLSGEVVGLVAISWAPLLGHGRWPAAVLVATVATEVASMVLRPPRTVDAIPVAVMVAAQLFAAHHRARVAWSAGAAASVALLVVGLVFRPGAPGVNIVVLDLVLAATGTGVFVRSRQQQLNAVQHRLQQAERTRQAEAGRQVTAERVRIARELHDVLAHSLTLVNAQAGVANYLLRSDPDAAAIALHGITDNTRQALDELRATVGLLRQDGDGDAPGDTAAELRPVPGLARLDELVTGFRDAGTTITTTVTGDPEPLSPRGDLAAYRITQEALTNATKHAPGAEVDVALTWLANQLELTVTNTAPPDPVAAGRGPGTGHGLIGMRERALTAGGTLRTHPTADGGFTVTATLPVAATDRPAAATT